MKKIIISFTIIFLVAFLVACKQTISYRMIFNYMGTETDITIDVKNEDTGKAHREAINDIYKLYNDLSEYQFPLAEDSLLLNNIYMINQRPEEHVEINIELYEMLLEAERIKDLTDGYFDISIGHIVSVWKSMTETYQYMDIPKEVFDQTMDDINDLEVIENGISLWIESNRYYIEIKAGVKLDVGAIAKGYSTEIVKDYIEEQGITAYSISGGSSSIQLGENSGRDTGLFNVSLANPVRTSSINRTYGRIFVKNTGVTTSGNYIQYATYEGLRYHHIVSPKTKTPVHYYHTVTIIGDNLGLLDAISTALISMPPEVFSQWLDTYQNELEIEIIRFNYDETITTFLTDTLFEEI
ncbi:MAG: FAD:protein FMN transferase [Acholeplasmataceae bacterium]